MNGRDQHGAPAGEPLAQVTSSVYGTGCLSRSVAVLAASGIHMVMSWRYNFANVVSAVVCIATSAAKEIAEDVSSHSRPFR